MLRHTEQTAPEPSHQRRQLHGHGWPADPRPVTAATSDQWLQGVSVPGALVPCAWRLLADSARRRISDLWRTAGYRSFSSGSLLLYDRSFTQLPWPHPLGTA